MMRKTLVLFVLLVISACSPSLIREEPAPQATQESRVTQADIDFVQSFANDVFTPDNWKSESTLHADRVMKTWHQNGTSNLAYLDYRIYTDGYTQEDLDDYYSEETFNEILYTYYDDLVLQAECSAGNLTLYEFSASYMDTPYLIRDWVDTVNPKRIADLSVIFTEADAGKLHGYAQTLFPALPRCE